MLERFSFILSSKVAVEHMLGEGSTNGARLSRVQMTRRIAKLALVRSPTRLARLAGKTCRCNRHGFGCTVSFDDGLSDVYGTSSPAPWSTEERCPNVLPAAVYGDRD